MRDCSITRARSQRQWERNRRLERFSCAQRNSSNRSPRPSGPISTNNLLRYWIRGVPELPCAVTNKPKITTFNKPTQRAFAIACASATFSMLMLASGSAVASSHMDAPLITLDPAANTTDVYAFVSTIGTTKYLTTALAVYPFEEPSIGPNLYNFDPNVRYEILVATGSDLKTGQITYTYRFDFQTTFKNNVTIAISYLGPIQN